MSPSPEGEPGLTERPAIPRPLAALLVLIIVFASGAALVWPSLPFNAPATGLAGPSAVGVITNNIEVSGSGGRVGALAPDFRWIDPRGTARTLSALPGRPVVLNFWATWLAPELPRRPLPARRPWGASACSRTPARQARPRRATCEACWRNENY